MTDWRVAFLEECRDGRDEVALGEGAFAPGPALWVGRREVAHFDDEDTLDVRVTKAVIRARRDELRADDRVTLRGSGSDWIEVSVATDGDRAWATALVADAIEANRPTAPPGTPPSGADLERRRRFH